MSPVYPGENVTEHMMSVVSYRHVEHVLKHCFSYLLVELFDPFWIYFWLILKWDEVIRKIDREVMMIREV